MAPIQNSLPLAGRALPVQALTYILIASLVTLPGLIRAAATQDTVSLSVTPALAFATPLAILALGWVTRGPVAARLLGLIVIYGWLSLLTT